VRLARKISLDSEGIVVAFGWPSYDVSRGVAVCSQVGSFDIAAVV
jgi:hypothetical protein